MFYVNIVFGFIDQKDYQLQQQDLFHKLLPSEKGNYFCLVVFSVSVSINVSLTESLECAVD